MGPVMVNYSDLLRFADPSILEPDTKYAMFIVAPVEKRNRMCERLLRLAFRRLELGEKVKLPP